MIINNLKVNQYRNLDEVKIEFHPYFNVFHGLNGQGKTNFIEAITYLSTLKSFRGSPDFEIIKKDKDFFLTKIQCQNEISKYDLQVSYTPEKRKIFIDSIFELLYSTSAETFNGFTKVLVQKLPTIIKTYSNLSDEDKSVMIEMLKLFIKSYYDSLKSTGVSKVKTLKINDKNNRKRGDNVE